MVLCVCVHDVFVYVHFHLFMHVHVYVCLIYCKGKRKLLPKKWRDLWMKGTHKHKEALLKHFHDRRCLSRWEESECIWQVKIAPHLYCVFTYIYSLLIEKNTVIVKLSFHVFICTFHPEISSFFSVRVFSFYFYSCVSISPFPFHVNYMECSLMSN